MNLPWMILKLALSKLAFSSTIVGDLPPNSRMVGVRFSAAALAINTPFYGEPVKTIKSKG